MEELEQLLHYFRHAEVSELVIQAGKVAALRVGGQLRALTKQVIDASAMYQMLDGTPLAGMAIRATSAPQSMRWPHGDANLTATVLLANGNLVIRFLRVVEGAASPPPPEPAPPPRPTPPKPSPVAATSNRSMPQREAPEPSGRRAPIAVPVFDGPIETEPASTAPTAAAYYDPSEREIAESAANERAPTKAYAPPTRAPVPVPVDESAGDLLADEGDLLCDSGDLLGAPAAAVQASAPQDLASHESQERSPVSLAATGERRAPSPSYESAPVHSHANHQPRENVSSAAPAPQAAPPSEPVVRTRDRSGFPQARAELSRLLGQGRKRLASDVHLVSDRPLLLRCAGSLSENGPPIAGERILAMLESAMDDRNSQQFHDLGYADFAFDDPEIGRFRANACRHKNGFKGCFRVLPPRPNTLEELGLPLELRNVLDYHQGLAIVSGPNGQGKTTTLAALVDLLNETKALHIITVEDPIEVLHPIKRSVLSQRQVGRDTATFASALKAALREDPDVIVIGELRDKETVEMALSAAETGHLVLATMNTPSGAKTIGRLIDLFPPDDQSQVRATLAGTLMIVASQRLVERNDGEGRVAACELITGGIPLWTLIRESKLHQLPGLMQRGRKFGMIRLADSLRELFDKGLITEATLKRYNESEKTEEAGTDAIANDEASPANEGPAALGAKLGGGIRNLIGGKGR
jgi:twitching motility protein PilT